MTAAELAPYIFRAALAVAAAIAVGVHIHHVLKEGHR